MATSYPHSLISWVVDMVFPYRCLGCQKYLIRSYLCEDCQGKIPVRSRLECVGCGRTVPGGITCPNCRPHYSLSRIFVVTEYHEPIVAEAIRSFKYKFLPELAKPLAGLAIKYVQDQSALRRISFVAENFTIMPVPLHRRRENWRGFNQASLIAKILAEHYRLPYSDNLKRDIHLTPQANIKDRNIRFENVTGAYFYNGPDITGKNILLIDDVCTTGATLNECAMMLKNNGAASVSALVIARG